MCGRLSHAPAARGFPMSALRAELSSAIRAGNVQQLRDLLSRRNSSTASLDLNSPSPAGTPSPLSEAVVSLRLPVVRMLLQAGAYPNGVTGEVAAPMTIAALQGRLDIVQHLINAGACTEINDGAPLYAICAGTSGSAVAGAKLLLSAGADCNRHPTRCAPPLIVAVNRSKLALVRVLLKAGADPSRQSTVLARGGERPLHVAVRNGGTAMIKLLLKFGADPSLTDTDGVNALQLAMRTQKEQLYTMMSHYASSTQPSTVTRGERRLVSRKSFIGRRFLVMPWRK